MNYNISTQSLMWVLTVIVFIACIAAPTSIVSSSPDPNRKKNPTEFPTNYPSTSYPTPANTNSPTRLPSQVPSASPSISPTAVVCNNYTRPRGLPYVSVPENNFKKFYVYLNNTVFEYETDLGYGIISPMTPAVTYELSMVLQFSYPVPSEFKYVLSAVPLDPIVYTQTTTPGKTGLYIGNVPLENCGGPCPAGPYYLYFEMAYCPVPGGTFSPTRQPVPSPVPE